MVNLEVIAVVFFLVAMCIILLTLNEDFSIMIEPDLSLMAECLKASESRT